MNCNGRCGNLDVIHDLTENLKPPNTNRGNVPRQPETASPCYEASTAARAFS